MKIVEKKLTYEKLIGNNYKYWNSGDSIIFNGGTGTRKTSWVFDVLQPYCKANNKKILYLSNRTKLKEQIEDAIKYKELSNIYIMNYQALERQLNDKIEIPTYDYIIADECHYFLTDAKFNMYTDLSFDYVYNNGNGNSIVIYMSATAYNLFYNLKYKGKVKPEHEYRIPIDYSYVDELIFYEKDDLEAIIENILFNTNDKVIYFCNSLERAKNIYNQYKDYANFIASKWNPKNKAYNEDCIKIHNKDLITFDKRLLVTNQALDNGVSIIDENVKHIITDIFDVDSMQQCLGRKRIINSNHKCKFYIRNYSKKDLILFEYNIKKELEPAKLFINNIEKFKVTYGKDRSFKNPCIWYDWDENCWKVNKIRFSKLLVDINTIGKMLEHSYKTEIIRRLGDTIKNITNYEGVKKEQKKNELEEYLSNLAKNKVRLLKPQQEELINIINLRDAKNRQQRSYQLFNTYFKVNKLPYQITSKQSSKIINGKKKNYRYWQVVPKFLEESYI